MSMQQELVHGTAMLQAMTKYIVVHKYFGDTTPYRWEIYSEIRPGELSCLGTIALNGPEISALYAMSLEEQALFFQAKLAAVIGHC